jgi:hypothetical protein
MVHKMEADFADPIRTLEAPVTFPQFVSLPAELRNMIWKQTLPGERLFVIKDIRLRGHGNATAKTLTRHPNPVALSVNTQSRQTTMLEGLFITPGVWFNKYRDILYLSNFKDDILTSSATGGQPETPLPALLPFPGVTKICVDAWILDEWDGQMQANNMGVPSSDEVGAMPHLFARFPDMRTVYPVFWKRDTPADGLAIETTAFTTAFRPLEDNDTVVTYSPKLLREVMAQDGGPRTARLDNNVNMPVVPPFSGLFKPLVMGSWRWLRRDLQKRVKRAARSGGRNIEVRAVQAKINQDATTVLF